jgi:Phage integrase central domain/Arm DNA-binding domain
MPLTAAAIQGAKPREKAYKLFDGGGLFLLVHPNGGRYWRLKYRIHGREKLLALGTFPGVTLAKARERRDKARKLIADNADPAIARQADKAAVSDTFRVIAVEWLAKQNLAPATLEKAQWTFEQLLFPDLGDRPIRRISAPDLLNVLRKIEARGAIETAHRAKQRASQVFRYAIATGRAAHDPTGGLRGALQSVNVEHRAAITEPKRVGELLRAIDGYVGQPSMHYALKLAPYVFVRPGELRAAEWLEFDFSNSEDTCGAHEDGGAAHCPTVEAGS